MFAQVDDERRKLSAILAQSSDVIITTNEKEQITLLNQSAERLFGITLEDAINRNIHAIDELAPVANLFAHAQTKKYSDEIELGDESYLLATVAPIANVGYLTVMQDITQIKLAEAQRLRTERVEKERIKRALNRYISPALLDDVLAENVDVFRSRSRQFAFVLFADLRNSTELVVKLPPDQAINLLNEFFDAMTTIIYEHEGTIFDLIGDELEIGFNVPLSQPDAIHRAFMTAVAMQQLFQELAGDWYEQSGVTLGLGIGIEMGEVVLGNVGARSRMHYAMVGRAVNVAHRLVDLAENGQIIVSKAVYDALQEEASDLIEQAGLVRNERHTLKGTNEIFSIYRFVQPVLPSYPTEAAFAVSRPDVDTVEGSA
ncbi:MAG: PAS domain S-box protein [Anaerolineae bacterium]|nr:PAS domain S-box protein [Anaerolineae bacterium]